MIAVLAAFLARRGDRIKSLSTIVGAGLLTAPPFVLIMIQPDLGTALVLVAIMVGALFLAGASLRWMLSSRPRRHRRVCRSSGRSCRDYQQAAHPVVPEPDFRPEGAGFQVAQAQIAVGSGGIFGKGLTAGAPRAACPFSRPTSPLPLLLEELGFIGGDGRLPAVHRADLARAGHRLALRIRLRRRIRRRARPR